MLNDEVIAGKAAARSPIHPSEFEGQLCEISISHDGDFATAIAIVPSMADKQPREHISSPLPSVTQSTQGISTHWDKLLAEVSINEISAVGVNRSRL